MTKYIWEICASSWFYYKETHPRQQAILFISKKRDTDDAEFVKFHFVARQQKKKKSVRTPGLQQY